MRLFINIVLLASILLITDAYQVIPLRKKEVAENKKMINAIISSFVQKGLNGSHLLEAKGVIDLSNFQDVQYFGTVSVGTPSQDFNVMFDTGSDLFWIPGPKDTDSCGYNHKTFEPLSSSSYVDLHETEEINYMKGSNKLDLVNETVTLGDIPIKNQILGLVKSGECEGHQFDGLMGMSRKMTRRGRDIPPVFESLINQKLVSLPIFSFYFNRQGKSGKGGELYIGGVNEAYVGNRSLNYLPVTMSSKHPFWMIEMNEVSVGSMKLSNQRGILDTGTSLILGTERNVYNIAEQLDAEVVSGVLMVSCSKLSSLPPVIFTIGGVEFKYTADDLVVAKESGYCLLGIGIGDTSMNAWLLGDAFLSKVYSIHDYSKERVALLPLNEGAQPETPKPSGGDQTTTQKPSDGSETTEKPSSSIISQASAALIFTSLILLIQSCY